MVTLFVCGHKMVLILLPMLIIVKGFFGYSFQGGFPCVQKVRVLAGQEVSLGYSRYLGRESNHLTPITEIK